MKIAKFLLAAIPCITAALLCLSPTPAEAQDHLWASHGPADVSDITGVALDPTNPQILYASSQGRTGIRKSLDGGQTWVELGAADSELSGLTCVAVDPSIPSNVYVGSAQGLVAASHDAGATWSKGTVGTHPVSSIAVEPASGTVYAATGPTTILAWGAFEQTYGTPLSRSTDAGNTWHTASLEEPRAVYALLADALHQTLFTGTDFAYTQNMYGYTPRGGSVGRIEAAGAPWLRPATDLGFSVTALAGDPMSGLVFAAMSSGQILRNGDAGENWTPLGKLAGTVSAMAVDPSNVSTLYAGLSHGGVWRSGDGGRSWRPFDSGLTSDSVSSLTIDPAGRDLYAGTRVGVFHRNLPESPAGPCQPGDDHLCLLGSRFRVDFHAMDPRTKAPAPAKALADGDRFGYFSIPSLTGDPSFPEVFVKMLDATPLPGQGYWLFSSSLTNVPYSLVVTDTTNGRVQLYDGQAFCGTADIEAFPADSAAAAPASGMKSNSPLAASGSQLALLSSRFQVVLSVTDPSTGTTVSGVAIPQGDRFGYFSLPSLTGDATLPEVFVKMLDATSLPDGDFWLFQGGLTTLPYTLTVTDSVTGAAKTYRNDPVDPTRLCGTADTRVTTGPTPTVLSGEWAGTASAKSTGASVVQSGDRLEVSAAPRFLDRLLFDGVLRLGLFEGVARAERLGCHYEGAASGTANSSRIQLTFEALSGTCGKLQAGPLDLTPAPE